MRKALIMPLLLVLFAAYSWAEKETAIEGLRYSSNKSHTRVVIDLNGPVEYTKNRISNPDRLFFDLKNCRISRKAKSSIPVKDGILKSVRLAQFNKSDVRVVFDLQKSKNYYAFMLEKPFRLVIDVYADKKRTTAPKKPADIKTLEEKVFPKIRTVVIDPGHGGKDPGAIGPRGLREKDIVLSVGKKLGKILEKKYGLKVIYTRKKDIFVPLNDRTEIANSKKADLFISIHTNASKTRKTRGIETYFLNWTNNKEAIRVAARENRITVKKMKKLQNELQFILHDLARNNKREESMRLAHSVQNAMVNTLKRDYRKIENLGVKYALFYVLVGAEMPSILAEISFISNREEEKRLSRESYKKRVAEAIAKGIGSYITQSTLIVKPVKKRELELHSNEMNKSSGNIQPQS
jgi:N-acetylmuramoyl-L-alanine amidase